MNSQKELIVFIGPPGAGKGSLSQLCVDELGWVQLSTGFLCRKHIAAGTQIGQEIDFSIKSGKLVEDRLIVSMVEQWLLEQIDQHSGVILDGFPRSVFQAQALDEILKKYASILNFKLVKLAVSDEILIDRLAARFVCENKDCQTVYSAAQDALKPKEAGICDRCSSKLVRRSDDGGNVVKERLKAYHGYAKPLIEYYEQQGKQIAQLDVEKPLAEVFVDFKNALYGYR
ncbi:nucleoside monophosphate kinase [Candidatus Dependentiae bacterium]|nr:nucleoside monophosphate kinase [Candidatus Dependentiae bacterium]